MSVIALLLAASAQSASPQRVDSPPPEARQALRRFADCAARRDPKVAHRFVMLNDGELLPRELYQDLFSGRCLGGRGGQLRMRSWRSRSALADSLIRLRPLPLDPDRLISLPALDWPALPESQLSKRDAASAEQASASAEAERLMSRLGECIVRADAPAALAALHTEIDSIAERERFQALAPGIAGCIAQGQSVSFTRTNLRSAVSLAYYRLAVAARDVTGGAAR